MNEHVFIAEDEPYIVESLGFVLSNAGYSITPESNGAAVVPRIREIRPDVVILDLMLPERNGFEVLKELKNDRDLRSIPVLILTAKGQAHDRSTAEQLGADAFITKPFSNRQVLECIGRLAHPGTETDT